MQVWASSLYPATLAVARGVGVCVWVRVSAAPRHSWLGCWGVCVLGWALPLYPSTPGCGVRCGCGCLGSGFGCAPPLLAGVLACACLCACSLCTPPLLAGVCSVRVCAWARVWAAPRHSWLECLGVRVVVRAPLVCRHSWLGRAAWVCVFEFGSQLRPATLGWGVGVCVCWCGRSPCTPPILAGVCSVGVCVWAWVSAAPRHSWPGSWGLRVGVRAPPLPCHSWLGCAVWMCVFGLGFWLRPATPGWGHRKSVCLCACSACTPPLLAGVCGVGVCAWARVSAAPRLSWLGCWGVCVLVCVVLLYPATPGWGVRCGCVCSGSGFGCAPPLLVGVCGVWFGRCLAPVPVPWFVVCCARCPDLRHLVAALAWHLSSCRGCGRRRASLACLVAPRWCAAPRLVWSLSVLQLAFLSPWCLSPGGGLASPALLGGCAGHAEAGQEPGSLCLPLAPAEAGALGSLRVVPVWGPAMGLSLAGLSGVGLGLRALRCLACVDPVTDASGFPYRPSFDGGLSRCTGAVSCGRRHRPFRVRGRHAQVPCVCACACFLGRVGQAGLSAAVRCTSPFPVAVLVALLVCSAPSGLGLPCLCCFWVFFVCFFFSPLVRPACLRRSVFSRPGCLGHWRLVVLPLPSLLFFFLPPACLFVCLFCCAGCAVPDWCVVVCGACWCVVLWALCFARGRCALALCCAVPLACASPLCVVACCVVCAQWRRAGGVALLLAASGGCRVVFPARLLGRLAQGGGGFASGLCWLCLRSPSAAGCAILCCGLSCFVWYGAAVLGVFCVLSVVVWHCCVLAPCCAGSCCAVVVVLCFRALLRSLLVFFCVVPCLSVVLRAVPVSLLCLCGAVLVCLRGCSLCAAPLPLRRWLVFCVAVCCVCVLAVGPGCPLLSPGGSLVLLVSCFGGVLWCVPG